MFFSERVSYFFSYIYLELKLSAYPTLSKLLPLALGYEIGL